MMYTYIVENISFLDMSVEQGSTVKVLIMFQI